MTQPHHDGERETDAEPPSDASIEIDIDGDDEALAQSIRAALLFAFQRHHIHTAALEIAIVDEPQMCAFHDEWMNDPTPTDVLTFDLGDEDSDAHHLEGQIIICEPVARQQADERGHHWHEEATLYAIHGVLHLVGFDDHDDDDFARMHAEEDAILIAMGKPPIFNKIEPINNRRRSNNDA